jgi:hypothetical protein
MNAAGMRARVERFTVLIDGIGKETNAILADRGELSLTDWHSYIREMLKAKDGLHAARMVLAHAADRLEGKTVKEDR